LLAVDEEVSEADLRDPIKQYKRYKLLLDAAWSRKIPQIDKTLLSKVATKEFADSLVESLDQAGEEGYYYDDPPGYEEINTGELVFSQQFFTKDEKGLDQFVDGELVEFKVCVVDDSVARDSKTSETIFSPSENLDTFEHSIKMIFIDDAWKIDGLNNINKTKGVVKCGFQN